MIDEFGYLHGMDVVDVFVCVARKFHPCNLLVVNIDSADGDHLHQLQHPSFDKLLQRLHANFWWTKVGLWLESKSLQNEAANDLWKAFPMFTAAYIMPVDMTDCAGPLYDRTSEDTDGESDVPDELKRSMASIGSLGYCAGGCGLYFRIVDEGLYEVVQAYAHELAASRKTEEGTTDA